LRRKQIFYHNELKDSYIIDENGEIIYFKSRELKGQPKIFKAGALSSNKIYYL